VTTLAADLALGLDPVRLAERCGLEPDPWQADVLRSASPRMLLNCSRQSGKSTTVALLSLHTALYRPGSLCLVLSPTLRQSGELFRRAKALLPAVGGAELDEETHDLSAELPAVRGRLRVDHACGGRPPGVRVPAYDAAR
jgi:hypothetical protein